MIQINSKKHKKNYIEIMYIEYQVMIAIFIIDNRGRSRGVSKWLQEKSDDKLAKDYIVTLLKCFGNYSPPHT